MPVKAWIAVAAIAGTVVGGCGGGDGEQRRASKAEGSWPPKVAPGTIKTVVGTGRYGFGGLGGPANKTELQLPTDLAFDDAGNLYIAERHNHRILKVDTSGIVTVAAGTVDEKGLDHMERRPSGLGCRRGRSPATVVG